MLLSRHRCIAIMGATATGKSGASLELAERFAGEIVSMDSRQVYRGLDIGTGKVTAAERERVPHHLIDILDPSERGSAGRHVALASGAVRGIRERGHLPMLVGGTGLYFRAYFEGLIDVVIPREARDEIRAGFEGLSTASLHEELRLEDPERAGEIPVGDRIRITRALELMAWTGQTVTELYATQERRSGDCDVLEFVLSMPRHLLRGRVAQRTRELFSRGWPDEVARLLDGGVSPDAPGMNSLGYAEIARCLAAGLNPQGALDSVVTATQQYAKRQETFFRRRQRAEWIDVSEDGWLERVERRVADFTRPE